MSRLTGTLTRWHLHPAEWLHRLPNSVSFEEGSLCEPLAVALAGIERSGLRLGDSTLIWYFGFHQSPSYLPDDFSVVLGRSVWFPCSLLERLVQSPLLLRTCFRAALISQRNWYLVSTPCSSNVGRHQRSPLRRSKQRLKGLSNLLSNVRALRVVYTLPFT